MNTKSPSEGPTAGPVASQSALDHQQAEIGPAGIPGAPWLPLPKAEVEVTDEMLPDPVGYRILLEMRQPRIKTEGGLWIPQSGIEAQDYMQFVGKVRKVGPMAFKRARFESDKFDAWCKPGDWITVGQHAGQHMEIMGVKFRFVNDESVLGVVRGDHNIIKVFIG